jgi:ABC-type nitrate/sulfonate/bicarbonate transport system substrate-binding protein
MSTSNRRSWIAMLCLGVALALTVSACADRSGSSSEGSSKNGPVTMAGVFCVCFANAYVAYEKGFFKDNGVNVKNLVTTKAGADTFQALAGGDAQLALNGLDAILRGQEQGIDVVSIGTVSPDFYALSVRAKDGAAINSPADLKGKKVSVSKIGSASWAFLQQLLKSAGLSDSDVKIVQLGGIDTTMAGLKSGTVDAAVTWEPGTSQGVDQGFAKVVLNSLVPADHAKLFGSEESISMTLATTKSFIKSQPETVKGAIKALDQADEWIASHTPDEVADVIAPLATGLDRGILAASIKSTMQTLPKSSAVSTAAYEDSARLLQETKIISKVPDVKTAFDCDIAECTE